MADIEETRADELSATAGPPRFDGGYMTFTLSVPITAHGKEVSELRIREPNGNDLVSLGNPVYTDMTSSPPRIIPEAGPMARMISRLCDIPPSSIVKISPEEQTTIAWLLVPFFVPKLAMLLS